MDIMKNIAKTYRELRSRKNEKSTTAIKKEIREEILNKVREGKTSVFVIAKQYEISGKSIYYWLRQGVGGITSQSIT